MAIFFDDDGRKISDVVVSTALGQSGRGIFSKTLSFKYRKFVQLVLDKDVTIFTKPSTRYPKVGNFRIQYPWTWKYIKKICHRSMLNLYRLTNNGVKINAKKIAYSSEMGFSVIPSYYPEFKKGVSIALQELGESVDIYHKYIGDDFWAIEINGSCVNSGEIIEENMDNIVLCVSMLKKVYPKLVIIIKTSIEHPYDFYKRLEDAGADAIHAINSIPYRIVYPNDVSPFHKKGGGGVSGEITFSLSYHYSKELKKYTTLPIIMGCGVTDIFSKIMFMKEADADSVSVCTIALLDPEEACRIIGPVDDVKCNISFAV